MGVTDSEGLVVDSRGRLILPSLIFTNFVNGTPGILTGLLLIDIGYTFGQPVGIMGQIRTVSAMAAVVSALLVGALSMRYRYKSLLMVGQLFLLVSALGCTVAKSFQMMLIFFPLTGFGMSIVVPMAFSLIARYFPLDSRAKAVGWMVAGGSLSYVVGSQVITYLAGIGGWRMAYMGFVIPAIILGLLLSYVGFPREETGGTAGTGGGSLVEGYRAVLLKRSAAACLFATVLRLASFQLVLLYATSFFRQQFELPRGMASLLMTGVALCYSLGSLTSGRLVGRFGRRRLVITTTLLAGLFTVLMTLLPNYWMAVLMDLLGGWFFGMSQSASQSLNLEQVPEFRGIMMSLNSATGSLGSALGAGIGGATLLAYGYWMSGTILGALGLVAALTYIFLTVDPTAQG